MTEDDDDFNLPSIFENYHVSTDVDSTGSLYQPQTITSTIPPLSEERSETVATTISNEDKTKVREIKECFKCSICYDIKFDVVFCRNCSRNLGCPACISQIDQCPRCRAKFEWICTNCNHTERMIPTSYRITGLEECFTE